MEGKVSEGKVVVLAAGTAAACRHYSIARALCSSTHRRCAFAKKFRRSPRLRTAPDVSSLCAQGPSLLETFPAVDWPSLRGLEGNRSFLPALRASGACFGSLRISRRVRRSAALGLARLAPFGLVLEALVGEEHLFAGGEDEFSAAFNALQYPVVIFH